MSGIPDFSLLVAIDREHLAEFALSYPTWARNVAGLNRLPVVIIEDRSAGSIFSNEIERIVYPWHRGPVSIIGVFPRPHSSQRERMLASLVFDGPAVVETPYYLKLDTDTIATPDGPRDCIDPAWFQGNPAIIAPPWGYAKPGSMLNQLDMWAAGVPAIAHGPAVSRRPVGEVAKYPRIISYAMFGRTDWTRKVAGWCGERLPVPSQDTTLHYCAVRDREKVVRVKMPGWRHIGGGGRRLEAAAEMAMQSVAGAMA